MSELTLVPMHRFGSMLCRTNAASAVERLNELLTDRWFTFVQANSYDEESDRFSAIDVNTSQRLTRPFALSDDGEWAHIGWGMSDYSCGVSTHAETVSEARKAMKHDWVHITLDRRSVVIDHFAPARYRLQWRMVLEHHDPEVIR